MSKNKTSELVRILGQELKWNKARLTCFSLMMLALLACRTISLYKMAVVMDRVALNNHHATKRLKRFFSGFSIEMSVVARLIFKWFDFAEKKLYLTIDRTNWYLGKAKINVFTLAVAYEGIAIPLFWQLLPKAGNASAKEHIELVESTPVFLAGSRSERGELMIVATNQAPKSAIAIYLRRWEIEMLFQSLKGRGFQFEQTHMTEPDRLETMMALLALTFCWAHKVGEWRAIQKPIPMNHYRDSRRPQFSYFRYGLDLLQKLVFKGYSQIKKTMESLFATDN